MTVLTRLLKCDRMFPWIFDYSCHAKTMVQHSWASKVSWTLYPSWHLPNLVVIDNLLGSDSDSCCCLRSAAWRWNLLPKRICLVIAKHTHIAELLTPWDPLLLSLCPCLLPRIVAWINDESKMDTTAMEVLAAMLFEAVCICESQAVSLSLAWHSNRPGIATAHSSHRCLASCELHGISNEFVPHEGHSFLWDLVMTQKRSRIWEKRGKATFYHQ